MYWKCNQHGIETEEAKTYDKAKNINIDMKPIIHLSKKQKWNNFWCRDNLNMVILVNN